MKTTAAILVAGSMLAAATPAMAQDSDFSGPRVEALVGYDTSRAGSSIDDDTSADNDQSIDGVAYGVGVGYDFDAGGVVLGLEAEYTGSTAEVEFNDGDFEGFGVGNVESGGDLYLGARLGFKANEDLLVYLKGGYTNTKYNIRSRDGDVQTDVDFDVDGWRAGAGIEYALSGNTFAKVEYRYSNYGSGEFDFSGDRPDIEFGDIDIDRHQVMAGFGLRF